MRGTNEELPLLPCFGVALRQGTQLDKERIHEGGNDQEELEDGATHHVDARLFTPRIVTTGQGEALLRSRVVALVMCNSWNEHGKCMQNLSTWAYLQEGHGLEHGKHDTHRLLGFRFASDVVFPHARCVASSQCYVGTSCR